MPEMTLSNDWWACHVQNDFELLWAYILRPTWHLPIVHGPMKSGMTLNYNTRTGKVQEGTKLIFLSAVYLEILRTTFDNELSYMILNYQGCSTWKIWNDLNISWCSSNNVCNNNQSFYQCAHHSISRLKYIDRLQKTPNYENILLVFSVSNEIKLVLAVHDREP